MNLHEIQMDENRNDKNISIFYFFLIFTFFPILNKCNKCYKYAGTGTIPEISFFLCHKINKKVNHSCRAGKAGKRIERVERERRVERVDCISVEVVFILITAHPLTRSIRSLALPLITIFFLKESFIVSFRIPIGQLFSV